LKVALITGITGQDGSYLAEFLLNKGYIVHGIMRRASSFNTKRIDHLIADESNANCKFYTHYGDMTDTLSLIHVLEKTKPDEIYNLAAQSHVAVSFEKPEYTANSDALGTLRILEAIRILGMEKKCRFYHASTSELFGKVQSVPQNEMTPFYPRSPYAVAKLYAYWIVINYREAYNLFAVNGILFNHESPRRSRTFVTRKITNGLARIKAGFNECINLGNLDAKRDWGHARDYVEMMWLMLQQDKPDDFVVSTGLQVSVKEFIDLVAEAMEINIKWEGEGLNKKAINTETNKTIVKVNKKYFRPTEVNDLLGDSNKAKRKLNWAPKSDLKSLVKEMSEYDLKKANYDFELREKNDES
tara:strand:+ start:2957 stop:4027 length:1071 start_codon:yes stop_codon:yes gene_type:complete